MISARRKWATWRGNHRDLIRKIYERDGFLCKYCGIKVHDLYDLFRMMNEKQKYFHDLYCDGKISRRQYLRKSDTCLIRSKIEKTLIFATIDHIIPLTKNGSNDISNLVTACQRCNSKKSNKILNG